MCFAVVIQAICPLAAAKSRCIRLGPKLGRLRAGAARGGPGLLAQRLGRVAGCGIKGVEGIPTVDG